MVRGVPLISVSKAKIFQRNNWDLCSFTPTCVDSSSDDSELSRINNFFGGDKDNCHVLTWQPSYEKKKLWRRLLHAALSSWCRFSLVSKVCLTLWYRTSVECQPCGYWKKKQEKHITSVLKLMARESCTSDFALATCITYSPKLRWVMDSSQILIKLGLIPSGDLAITFSKPS